MSADPASDSYLFQIQKDREVCDIHSDLHAESAQDLQRHSVSRAHLFEELPAVDKRICAEADKSAVEVQKTRCAADHADGGSRIMPVCVCKAQETEFSRCEVTAVQDLSVNDQAASDTGTDDVDAGIAAAS